MEENKVLKVVRLLKHNLFADRNTIEEAREYAYTFIEALPNEIRLFAFTALHVMLNTVAKVVEEAAKDESFDMECCANCSLWQDKECPMRKNKLWHAPWHSPKAWCPEWSFDNYDNKERKEEL